MKLSTKFSALAVAATLNGCSSEPSREEREVRHNAALMKEIVEQEATIQNTRTSIQAAAASASKCRNFSTLREDNLNEFDRLEQKRELCVRATVTNAETYKEERAKFVEACLHKSQNDRLDTVCTANLYMKDADVLYAIRNCNSGAIKGFKTVQRSMEQCGDTSY